MALPRGKEESLKTLGFRYTLQKCSFLAWKIIIYIKAIIKLFYCFRWYFRPSVEDRGLGEKHNGERGLSASPDGQRATVGREFLDEWILCKHGWPVRKPGSHSKIY